MTNNYIASARDALATPLTDWNKASNNADRKASGLGAIAIEHEIKSTDTFAPILGKDKVNPKSTASVELFGDWSADLFARIGHGDQFNARKP